MIPAATTGWAIYPGLAGMTISLKDIGGHGTGRPGYSPGTRGATRGCGNGFRDGLTLKTGPMVNS